MSGQDWIDINEFSKNVGLSFLFDVNVLIRDVENKWSSSNARKLLKFSSKQGFDDITWELGNEPNSLKVVKSQRVLFNLVSSRKKMKKNIEISVLLLFCLGSFHKLRLHLGLGRWSEKLVVYYIKSAN